MVMTLRQDARPSEKVGKPHFAAVSDGLAPPCAIIRRAYRPDRQSPRIAARHTGRKVRAPQGGMPANGRARQRDGKWNREQNRRWPSEKAAQVRVKRCGKSAPCTWQQGAAGQTPFGARPNRTQRRCPPSVRVGCWSVSAMMRLEE